MITATDTQKTCTQCGKPLRGRADKRFCDDYCRSQHNNRLNSDASALVKKINHSLRKNRRIIQELLIPSGGEARKIVKAKLVEKGFDFEHFTHLYTTNKQGVYYFCYEYGYLSLSTDCYLLVKMKKSFVSNAGARDN